MSTLEEVKEEIKKLAKDITELDGQIETLLDNPGNNVQTWFIKSKEIYLNWFKLQWTIQMTDSCGKGVLKILKANWKASEIL